jgi:hypothetical protein
MEAAGLELLRAWEGFYLIVGPSAAVLIGLQFVVIVMTAELHVVGDNLTVSAFSSPTIVHYCMALLVSSVLIAPWPELSWAAATLTLCGLGVLATHFWSSGAPRGRPTIDQCWKIGSGTVFCRCWPM